MEIPLSGLRAATPASLIDDAPPMSAQRAADVVVVYGPDADPNLMEQIDRQCAIAGVRPMIIGNGREDIHPGQLTDLRRDGKIGPNTHLLLALHGDQANGRHFVVLSRSGATMPTADFISHVREPDHDVEPWTGALHLLACKDGALAQEIGPESDLWKMGPCLLYTGTEDAPTNLPGQDLPESIRFIGESIRNGNPPSALEVFAHLANSTGDTVSLIGGRLEQPLTVDAPRNEADLAPGALEAEWRKLQTEDNLDSKTTSRISGAPKDVARLVQTAASDPAGSSIETRRLKTLFTQAQKGRASDVEATLKAHPELLKATDEAGDSLLHHACAKGNLEVVRLLLKLGMDVNADATGRLGETALHAAAAAGDGATVRELLAAGAKVDSRMREGATPLGYAVRSNKPDVVAALAKAGADPHAADAYGNSPLSLATMLDLKPIQELLARRPAEVRTDGRARL